MTRAEMIQMMRERNEKFGTEARRLAEKSRESYRVANGRIPIDDPFEVRGPRGEHLWVADWDRLIEQGATDDDLTVCHMCWMSRFFATDAEIEEPMGTITTVFVGKESADSSQG